MTASEKKLEILISFLDLNTRMNQVQGLFDWRHTEAFHLNNTDFTVKRKLQAAANRSPPLVTDFDGVGASYVIKYSVIHTDLQTVAETGIGVLQGRALLVSYRHTLVGWGFFFVSFVFCLIALLFPGLLSPERGTKSVCNSAFKTSGWRMFCRATEVAQYPYLPNVP